MFDGEVMNVEYSDFVEMCKTLEAIDGMKDSDRLSIVESTASALRENIELRKEQAFLQERIAQENERLNYA